MVAMYVSLVTLFVRLPYGWLADIFKKNYLLFISFSLISVSLFLFSFVGGGSLLLVVLFVIVYGLGLGGVTPIMMPIVREYFGTRHFGTIFGLLNVFMTLGVVVAPPLVGWVYDVRGVYHPAWLVLGGLIMAGAILILTMPSSAPEPSASLTKD